MKRLWNRFRDWLIRKLGGFTQQEMDDADEDWNVRMDEARARIALLELQYARKTEALKQAEEKGIRTQKVFEQRLKILQAVKILNPFGAADQEIVEHARRALAEQIAQEAKSAVAYHEYGYFDGSTKIVAVLRVMSGPEPLD